jgi:hypothetical protein
MADRKFPSGDDDARTKPKGGRYFVLPSETAEQFKRTEAELEKSPDRTIGENPRRLTEDDD